MGQIINFVLINEPVCMRTLYKIFLNIILLLFMVSGAPQIENTSLSLDTQNRQQIIWHIKAIHPDGYTLDVKAFDDKGNKFDVKAIQDSTQRYIMDVKAFMGSKELPVKVLVSEEAYKPVVAIDEKGNVYEIKAIDKSGQFLSVKGVRKSGYIVHIKALDPGGEFYGVKAISSTGKLNDVKGVKMYDKRLETILNGVEVHAHVVALPQIQ